MNLDMDERQRFSAPVRQTTVSARAIVLVGVVSLLLILIDTITVGFVPGLFVGMALPFVVLLVVIRLLTWRNPKSRF